MGDAALGNTFLSSFSLHPTQPNTTYLKFCSHCQTCITPIQESILEFASIPLHSDRKAPPPLFWCKHDSLLGERFSQKPVPLTSTKSSYSLVEILVMDSLGSEQNVPISSSNISSSKYCPRKGVWDARLFEWGLLSRRTGEERKPLEIGPVLSYSSR